MKASGLAAFRILQSIAYRRAVPALLVQVSLTFAFALRGNHVVSGQENQHTPTVVQGSLAEIRRLKHVHLVVLGGATLDARDPLLGIAEALRNQSRPTRRQGGAYNVIARKLNNYMRKHDSMSASAREDADYLIVFNLLRYRRLLSTYYPSGELYVVLEQKDGSFRFLWRTDKEMLAEDAINRLITEMKTVRGEK